MAQTQLNEKLGSSSSPFQADIGYNPKSSAFDLGFKLSSTIDIGCWTPVDVIPVVPGDKFKISARYLLDTFPLEVPPMTNYKVITHYYYNSWHSLWDGAETFVTKGRNNNINLEKPSASYTEEYECDHTITNGKRHSLSSPMGLSCMLGLPPVTCQGASHTNYLPFTDVSGTKGTDYFDSGLNHVDKVNALIPFMYQKIYRANYLPTNLTQDNKIWFPDNISNEEWRINFNSTNLSEDGFFVPIGSNLPDSGDEIANFVPISDSSNQYKDNCVNIWQLRYGQYGDDYFTTAKPWLVRGEEQTIDVDVTGISGSIIGNSDYVDVLSPSTSTNVSGLDVGVYQKRLYASNGGDADYIKVASNDIASKLGINLNGSARATLTANTLRNLVAFSVKDEIDALTNGNYNSTIRAHFQKSPKHEEFEPQYIGGTVSMVNMSSIIQTSASTGSNPLGSNAGLGQSNAQGYIGEFSVPDHGYIMAVMCIVPEVTYSQGLDHMWFDLTPDSVFWPEYTELGFQPILNKEIYISGNQSVDDDLFGYQTRYAYMKARQNKVSGLLALPSQVDKVFSAYSQTRFFDSVPKLSTQFVTMSPDKIRRDFLAYPSQPAFRLQFATDLSSIRPLPYRSIPNRFGV